MNALLEYKYRDSKERNKNRNKILKFIPKLPTGVRYSILKYCSLRKLSVQIIGASQCGKTELFKAGALPFKDYVLQEEKNFKNEVTLTRFFRTVQYGEQTFVMQVEESKDYCYSGKICQNVDVFIVCFDLTNKKNMENTHWQSRNIYEVRIAGNTNIRKLLCGCKLDKVIDDDHSVTKEEGDLYAWENGFDSYTQTSALQNQNIDEVFQAALMSCFRPVRDAKKTSTCIIY